MALSWQQIKYGWIALVGVAITGVTIYVANNTRNQVQQIDIIELALGTTERCLATQYSTNPVSYYVSPPSFIRSWVTTNNTGGYITNDVTNAIGWYVDRDMLVSLDATIKLLVPYYLNPTNPLNTDFSYNYLTITGLWASLGIGDGTNQFTSVPCWTNPVSTNYYVCYTSYWPTNASPFPTTNNYTSSYNQVVNYATNWDGTNVYWTTVSNWPSEVVQTTNIATYGEYPWQMYKTDLEERYRVLEALKIRPPVAPIATYTLKGWEQKTGECQTTNGYDAAKAGAISNFNVAAVQSNYPFWWAYRIEGYGKKNCLQIYKSGDWYNYYAALNATRARWTVSLSPPPYFGSNTINGKCVVLLFTEGGNIFDLHHSIDVFAGFDSGLEEINKPFLFSSNSISTGEPTLEYDTDWFGSLDVPDGWVDPPTPIEGSWALKSKGWSGKANGYYGMGNGVSKFIAYMLFDSACFSYCTNKYW